VQRNQHHRIELLITLVLCTAVMAAVWTPTDSAARGLMRPGAATELNVDKPHDAIITGEPDLGGTATPPPPPSLKNRERLTGRDDGLNAAFVRWVHWTRTIWATLYLRLAR
jgi:hypothetical protein